MILPGATLGVLGGGQLGRMFVVAARTMGYDVVVLDPDPESPAAQLATDHLCAGYDDEAALARLGERCAAVTVEFENVPAATLERLERSRSARHASTRRPSCAMRASPRRVMRRSWAATISRRHLPRSGRRPC